jgi:hypothetical protein
MSHNFEIHALIEQHTHSGWNIAQTFSLPAAKPNFYLHLDLQMGPIFITIGHSLVDKGYSPKNFAKETA